MDRLTAAGYYVVMPKLSGEVLFSAEVIRAGVVRLAEDIRRDMGPGVITLLPVLRGAILFAADLARAMPGELRLDFIRAESYRNSTVADKLRVDTIGSQHVKGARVLVLDDIADTGRTLQEVCACVTKAGALEVRSCVFLRKEGTRVVDHQPDYHVFNVPDVFVVGYGLDYDGRYWNLEYVTKLEMS